jgi:hypothetical protein
MRMPVWATKAGLAFGRRLAMLRHDAGALSQSSSRRPRRRPASLGVQVRCHSLGITESQQRACTDASGFIQLPNPGGLVLAGLLAAMRQILRFWTGMA